MASKVPPTLKGVGSYVKIANENASRDPVVYYWCLYYAVQHAMLLDKKSPEALQFITGLLGTLEAVKKQMATNDGITNEIVAQAHLEQFAWKLFNYAYEREQAANIDKSVVHAFFTAGHVFDVLALFGEIDEQVANTKKFAKWKCMQISQCLKDGTPYVPSKNQEQQQNEEDELLRDLTSFGAPTQPQHPANSQEDLHGFEQNYGMPQQPSGPPVPHHSTVPGQTPYGFNAPAPSVAPPVPQPPAAKFVPVQPAPPPTNSFNPHAGNTGKQPTVKEFTEAKKFLKYAMSACDFEDTNAVIDNLRKAMQLMGEA